MAYKLYHRVSSQNDFGDDGDAESQKKDEE